MVLDGKASDPVPVLSGVGSVLFLIFINDLTENIRSSFRHFADDCVLYRNIESPMDCQILQDDMNSLAQWERDWQMKFNVAKCHSMRVTRHPPNKHRSICIIGIDLSHIGVPVPHIRIDLSALLR